MQYIILGIIIIQLLLLNKRIDSISVHPPSLKRSKESLREAFFKDKKAKFVETRSAEDILMEKINAEKQ